jgi:TPR repeat protein
VEENKGMPIDPQESDATTTFSQAAQAAHRNARILQAKLHEGTVSKEEMLRGREDFALALSWLATAAADMAPEIINSDDFNRLVSVAHDLAGYFLGEMRLRPNE